MEKENDFEIKYKNLKLIAITCLVLGVIIDIIHNIKMNLYIRDFIIPLAIMLVGHTFLINKNKLEKNKKAYLLLIPISLILISNIIVKIDYSNKFLNIFILPLLISTFFFSLTNKNYKISKESVFWIFKLFPKNIFCNLNYVKKIFKNSKTKSILNIVIGFLIGIPIAVILMALLTNADRYFSEFIGNILSFLPTISFRRISDLVIIIITSTLFFSIFINIFKNKNATIKKINYKEINTTIASTILIIINIVFAIFLISEISKLTINFLHLPIEYTYAKYAREGFFQLLIVTAINYSIIFYYTYCTKKIENKTFIKRLLILLISFSIILILNSYYRMFLYISAYGFTILRLQVILFLTMELILFGILVKKLVSKLNYDDTILFVTTLLLFYILNIYFCTNQFIKLLNP